MLTQFLKESKSIDSEKMRRETSATTSTLRKILDIHAKCPVWMQQWKRASQLLETTGKAQYRGFHLLKIKDSVLVSLSGENYRTIQSHEALFSLCHTDVAVMLDALKKSSTNDDFRDHLCKILLAQFPHDKAWTQMIRHRVGIIKAREKRRAHDSATQPRLLAERRHSLVLIKTKGVWHTRKGVPLDRVLVNSQEHRRIFIELLTKMPGLIRIEIPTGMDFAAAIPAAERTLAALTSRNHTAAKVRRINLEWCFAIRRIRGMGLKGCFDPATQTVIVDPRHMDSLGHEVCHWMLGHDVGNLSKQDREMAEKEVHQLMKRLFP